MHSNKKKVTLSLDSKIYSEFQRYCEENAIMLSKKIELAIRDIMKKKKAFVFFFLTFLTIVSLQGVFAATIFSDGFESGGVTNWTLTANWHANNTGVIGDGIPMGSWEMISSNSGVNVYSQRNISTAGYNNITFSFYYKTDTNLLDAGEYFTAEWFDGSVWSTVFNISGSSVSYLLDNNSLGIGATDNPNFKIRFGCNSNQGTEGCAIDDVNITGNSIASSTFPRVTINSPTNLTFNTSTLNLNVSVDGPNISSVWISIDGRNITYAHRNGTIDFGYLDLIFVDDFDSYSEGSNGSPVWDVKPWFQTAIIENKTYKLYNETALIDALASINNFSLLDYWASAKVMVPSGSNGSAYLTPRFGDVNNKYEIALDYDFSSININKAVNGNWSSLAALWTGDLPSPVFVSKNEWHLLGSSVKGNNISAYVDGQLALNVTDSSLNNATFSGFSLIALDDVTLHTSYFDDLEIHKELAYGAHTLIVYANNTNGEVNSSTVTFFINASDQAPLFSNYSENPSNNSAYIQGQSYEFNVTITESNLDTVKINFNGTNYTSVYARGGGIYSFNRSDLFAGIHNYYWWANNTNGNTNSSSSRAYFVGKALTTTNITTIPNSPITYGTQSNFSCSNSLGFSTTLYINGVDKSSEKNINITRAAGSYTVNCSFAENQNYSESSQQSNYVINNASGQVSLLLNDVADNLGITYPQQSNLSASTIYGGAGNIILYLNGTDITSQNNLNVTRAAGYYNVTAVSSGDANHSSSSVTYWLNISRATSNCSLNFIPGTTITYGTQVNVSASCTNPESNSNLYRNNSLINSENGFNVTLSAGTYSYVVNVSQTQNYSSAESANILGVNKAQGQTNLFLNGLADNLTLNYPNQVNASASTLYGTIALYRDGVDVTFQNNQNLTLGVNYYNYTAISPGDANHSSASLTYWINLTQNNSVIFLYLNNSRANITISFLDSIPINATLQQGQGDILVYKNGGLIYQGPSPSYNLTSFSSPGIYNITAWYQETQNYTSSFETWFVNVTGSSQNLTAVTPKIKLFYPSYSSTYTNNTSITLSFLVVGENINSCWYNIDNSNNISIPGCLNTTFSGANGMHNLTVYSNESVQGLQNFTATRFYINNNNPTIHLLLPENEFYTNESQINFSYIPTSPNLSFCELWGNFSGIFSLNQTNNSVISGAEQAFHIQNFGEGIYSWAIGCNASENYSMTGNRTFVSDAAPPSVNLTNSVSGTQTSAGVTFQYLINDSSPTTCLFNVTSISSGSVVFSNLTRRCDNIVLVFNVDNLTNGEYQSNFVATDAAGNSQTSTTTFTVVVNSVTTSSGSGGSGGSSGGGIIPLKTELTLGKINDLIVNNVGIKKILSLKAKNTGTGYLNDCVFKSKGEFASWTTKTETKGLSAGEEYEFIFDVNIPENTLSKTYKIEVGVVCKEKNASASFNIEVIEKALNFALIGVERSDKDKVKVDYSLEELSGKDQNVEIQFLLYDKDGKKITEINETRFMGAVSKADFETFITIPEDLQGEIGLLVNLNSERYSGFVQERVILGSFISGLTILDRVGGSDNFFSILIVVLFLAFTFFVVRRIRNHKSIAKSNAKYMVHLSRKRH